MLLNTLYGMPAMDEELRKDIDNGKIVLGGCMVIDGSLNIVIHVL